LAESSSEAEFKQSTDAKICTHTNHNGHFALTNIFNCHLQ
jgi:hypothetical protein